MVVSWCVRETSTIGTWGAVCSKIRVVLSESPDGNNGSSSAEKVAKCIFGLMEDLNVSQVMLRCMLSDQTLWRGQCGQSE